MASDQIVQVTETKIGSVTITGVTSVSYSETGSAVSNRADGEVYITGHKIVSADVSGSISGIDQKVFASVDTGTEGDLTVKGLLVSTGTAVTLTITGILTLGFDGSQSSGDGSASINFQAKSADGTTSPIAYA